MSRTDVAVKRTDSILDELNQLQQAISERAYGLFRTGASWGGPLSDWLIAERQLVSKPAIELRQLGDEFELRVALPGMTAKDVDVQVTPDDLLVKAGAKQERTGTAERVHVSEFATGSVFRSIHFPEKIDPSSVKAEFRNGMLDVTAAIAKAAAATKVNIKAA